MKHQVQIQKREHIIELTQESTDDLHTETSKPKLPDVHDYNGQLLSLKNARVELRKLQETEFGDHCFANKTEVTVTIDSSVDRKPKTL